MASIYRRKINGKPSKCWYIAYRDHSGKRRVVKGYTDKRLTMIKAAKIEQQQDRIKEGMAPPEEAPGISKAIARFIGDMKRRNLSPVHIDEYERILSSFRLNIKEDRLRFIDT